MQHRDAATVPHLMEDWCDGSRDGGHDPHPVSRTATSSLHLRLHVCHETLCSGVVVHNREIGLLEREEYSRLILQVIEQWNNSDAQ